MKARIPKFVWLGVGLAVGFWLAESLIHAFIFDSGPLVDALRGGDDPNEVWMRVLVSALFVGFGWIADRSIQAERHLREEAQRLNRLLRFLDHVMQSIRHRTAEHRASPLPDRLPQPAAALSVRGAMPGGRSDDAVRIEDLALSDEDIGKLTRSLQELSSFVDVRFKELYALLQLTHEINMGLLLDEVLEKAYVTLRSVLPYNRLGLALIEDDGQVARARWARSDGPEMMLGNGFTAPLEGSSLQEIILSGEPRIINDLTAYLEKHPRSQSTRLIVAEGIRSNLTCPLISSGRPIGFMFFSSRTTHTYKDVHVEIFKLIAGHLSVVLEKSNLYQQVLREKENSERLMLNVMPARITTRLHAKELPVAESLRGVSILFVDIVDFSRFANGFSPERVVDFLQGVFVRLDRLCDLYDVEKIKTTGDQYMAICGGFDSAADRHLQDLAEFALGALASAEEVRYPDGEPMRIRIGMHTGLAVAGVIGQKKFAYDVWGDAVNVASRMESSGEAGRIHVTQDVYARLQKDFLFEERGTIEIKGKGPMKTYFLKAKKSSQAACEGV